MKNLVTLAAILFGMTLPAQHQIGLRISNYSGVNSLELNPSSFSHSPLRWDLNIVSGGFFVENEYLYFENTHLIELVNHRGPVLSRNETTEQNLPEDPEATYFQFYDATRPIHNSLNAFAGLPSIAFKTDRFSFALFANIRTAFSANKLDPDLDYFSLDQWPEGFVKTIDPTYSAGMLWSEVGINAATRIRKYRNKEIHFGINLKYLTGYEGFYLSIPNSSQVTKITDSLLLRGGPYQYGIASGLLNENNGLQANGTGWGADIGLTYLVKSRDERPYVWKAGLSLIDLGYVHFYKNAQAHSLRTSDLYTIDEGNLNNANGISGFTAAISQQSLGDPDRSRVDNEFSIYTPAALSLQADYALTPHWYIHTVLNQRVKLSPQMIERENFWALSARYETRWVGAGIPFTLYNWRHFRIGTWLRLGILTIGSENLASLFIKDPQFTGSDVYFALKLNPFSRKQKNGPEVCPF